MTAKRVLIVDDSVAARIGIRSSLSKAGYEVIEAASGQEGITKLENDPSISLMLVDYHMEVMNGLEMISIIRKNPLHEKIPVVMLTSESSKEARARSRELGVLAWAVKPCSMDLVVELIGKILSARNGAC
ncbi:MAG: response regulator [Oligoflexales bacterium]|nr:response regulator [Oligoflexales bacterium]